VDAQRRQFLERLLEAATHAADELRTNDGDRYHHDLIADIDALRLRVEDELATDPGS
jgi:hypothetical protein